MQTTSVVVPPSFVQPSPTSIFSPPSRGTTTTTATASATANCTAFPSARTSHRRTVCAHQTTQRYWRRQRDEGRSIQPPKGPRLSAWAPEASQQRRPFSPPLRTGPRPSRPRSITPSACGRLQVCRSPRTSSFSIEASVCPLSRPRGSSINPPPMRHHLSTGSPPMVVTAAMCRERADASLTRVTKEGRTLTYFMTVIQQPERARACGSGAKCKPLPPILPGREREREREKQTETFHR